MIDQTTSGIETTFYFIQKTWYKPLEDLAPTLRNYDVIVANSAWWDIQRGGGEDKCIAKGMYENADCLATYESQLTEMSSNILQAFGSNKKAAMFRTSNCCGGTSSYQRSFPSRTASPSPRSRRGPSTARRASRRATSATTGTTTASRTGASASRWARACWSSPPDARTSNF